MRQSNLVCTPLAAAGRWFGVILSDSSKPGPLSDEERYLLWTLGKTAALATLARVATTAGARARQLQERIDLARDVHEGVIQRLFGVQLVFSSLGRAQAGGARSGSPPSSRPRSWTCGGRCSARSAAPRPETQTTLLEEVERLSREHPDLHLTLSRGSERVRRAQVARAARAVRPRRGRPQRAQARAADARSRCRSSATTTRSSSTSATTASAGGRRPPAWASSSPRSRRCRRAGSWSSASASRAPGGCAWRCRLSAPDVNPARLAAGRGTERAPPARARRRRPRGRALGAAADARRAALGRALPERAQHRGGAGDDQALRAARRARRPLRRPGVRARRSASACARSSRRRTS